MSSEHEELLNPAISPGRCQVLAPARDSRRRRQTPKDRRAEAAAAHKARASTQQGFGEAPQTGYVAKSPVKDAPPEINAKLAEALGYRLGDDEDGDELALPPASPPPPQALDALLREGRREFRARTAAESLDAASPAAAGEIRRRHPPS